jgi:Ca2+-binding RTX toxin-like protein
VHRQCFVMFALAKNGVRVDLRTGVVQGEGTDRLSGIENVFGSPQADEIYGDAAYNYLSGGEGNDLLDGRGPDDTLDAGNGSDPCLDGGAFIGCENRDGSLILPPPPPS